MATKLESEYASSPRNDDSDGDPQGSVDDGFQEEEEELETPASNNNVQDILRRLQSTGSLITKPKEEYLCRTCDEDFPDWEELENHLIQHVSLPSVVLDKLPSDDEDTPPSGDENWSDEEDASPPPKAGPTNIGPKTTPQKIDISQILKNKGISLKKPSETDTKSSDSALSKLSGLGFTIKKNSTPIKNEPKEKTKDTNDVMQKLGKLGGIKLKLKSDGNNSNSFKVVNGLKDFNATDEEDEGSGNDESRDDQVGDDEDDIDKSCDQDVSGGELDSAEEENSNEKRKDSESDLVNKKIVTSLKNIQVKPVAVKRIETEPLKEPKIEPKAKPPIKPLTITKVQEIKPPAKPGRPAVKQTPKRGANILSPNQETSLLAHEVIPKTESIEQPESFTRRDSTTERRNSATERRNSATERRASITERRDVTPIPERQTSHDANMDNVVVKQEVESGESQLSTPLFSGQIKSERTSPPPTDTMSTPILTSVKSEPEAVPVSNALPLFSNQTSTSSAPSVTTPLLPVTKTEDNDNSMTIIEINGDSNDEDDDCCVVSATPAPDIKPIIPKVENASLPYPPPTYVPPSSAPTSATSYATPTPAPTLLSRLTGAPSTEKQHNFNWNAPDSKPPLDLLEKSADDIFESLLSASTKKENMSLSDASEYISIDTLGPQHTCDVCNTRFTEISLLDEHRRMTGHSKSLVAPSSSTLLPYNPSANLLSSLIPVKQLAEQVGKLSGMGSAPGFTHQQNVMINIQAYPGAGGVMGPHQTYNSYGNGTATHPNFSQASSGMYGNPGQAMPGQYPGQHYMGQTGYGQYQQQMPKPGYPGSPNSYAASAPYSSASPLQNMQQSYGVTSPGMMNTSPGLMNTQPGMGQMGPPGSVPGQYVPSSSPNSMKQQGSGVRIQNVQTFAPGQLVGVSGQPLPGHEMGPPPAPGQVVGGQMPSPSQIRMAAGATVTGARPRMTNVRGARPSIRPGIQVHGQVRGGKAAGPRMPLKRPGGMLPGPGQKRRPDMLLPGKHDNEDCQVMAMQKQRDGLPMIQSVQGAKDKLNLGSGISITKKPPVNKEANAMANVLASRGISIKQKQKSRSPSPERPLPHIPNLGAGVSIKHSSKSSSFSIPEAKVGSGMLACRVCKKMFMNQSSLQVHMLNAHPQSKIPMFKCDECPASYPKSLQLQHHKRVFHNVSGPNRELGLPVVDLSQEDNLKQLRNLGIYSFIPLANREQASGCFGIPVVSVHNGMSSNLQALGADGLLSLGPLKPLPNS